MSIMNVITTLINHGWERVMAKPVSVAISIAAAINSAIRPNPSDVIIALTAARQRDFSIS